MGIVILGSVNMDLVARLPRLPVAGETLLGEAFTAIPGGKGANQAVATARLGAATRLVARVGDDAFGTTLIEGLEAAGVGTAAIAIQPGSSGVALIAVAKTGENQIIVVPGANATVGQAEIEWLERHLSADDLLLLQFEVPLGAVCAAAAVAQTVGTKVIVDPAPARTDLPSEFYRRVDILTPNQTEAEQLTGMAVGDRSGALAAIAALHRLGVRTVILKLGRQGAIASDSERVFAVPAFQVEAIDTVAAGDAFNGGLAVALSEGKPLPEAVVWASAVAARSVTQVGAQPSMPDRAAVEALLQEQSEIAPIALAGHSFA